MTLPRSLPSRGRLGGRIIVVLLAITSALSTALAAQERSRIWLGLGLGSGARSDGASGGALMAEVVYQVKAHHLAIRGLGVIDPFSTGADGFGELGALYGRAAKRKWGHGVIAAGLALTGVESCRTSDIGGCTTLGVPVLAEAALRLGSIAGLGIQGFANLNPKSVYGGIVVLLQLGWLPTNGPREEAARTGPGRVGEM